MPQHTVNALGQPVGMPVSGEFPRPTPARTGMQGRFCSVVPLDAKQHTSGLYRAFAEDKDGRNWTYLPEEPITSEVAFADWMVWAENSADPLFHTVLDGDGAPVGHATYLRIQPDAGVIEVGYIHFSPLLQRTPLATEAMYLMMRRVFDELGYRRYEWKCDALNAPSRSAAERLGFTFEGVFRQATHYKGRNRDTAWYSILDSEWPRIQSAFETWLSPENFDQSGQQRHTLQARAAE
ncbi:GNAT family N-acetyltransferase [Ruegeria lacuscaerulensis]|uniref:GNAT family N-acetyltransferase n=1 Tax=Ruegeria lacuscaerulensis TaxID=55218 RepID=UPI00147F1347|nr:GNAT family protein [Ruegeria lacuscaerulensis]